MATPAAHDHALPEGQEPGRPGQEPPRLTPPAIEPLRAVPPRAIPPPVPLPPRRSQPPVPRGPRRVGLFQKILLGDLTLWFVLSAVLTYEVFRQHLAPEHALFGALIGLAVALAVAVGLKQVANRVVQLNRSALEISRGDLSKPLSLERIDWLGRDEVDELTTAISNMQANLRELVGHIQRTSSAVADSADEMQESSANVSGQAENIDRSMARIKQGAEHQLKLAESAGRSAEQISRLAHEISQRSQHAVAAMKEGIDELGQGREDLAQIILSLDEIVTATQAGSERVQVISAAARDQLESSAEM